MFQALLPLLASTDLTLHLHREADGSIRVTGVPKRTDDRLDTSLFQPFSLCGSAAALDQQFATLVASYQETREDLATQMQKTTQAMTKAVEAAKTTKTTKTTKSTKASAATQKGGTTSSQADPKAGEAASQRPDANGQASATQAEINAKTSTANPKPASKSSKTTGSQASAKAPKAAASSVASSGKAGSKAKAAAARAGTTTAETASAEKTTAEKTTGDATAKRGPGRPRKHPPSNQIPGGPVDDPAAQRLLETHLSGKAAADLREIAETILPAERQSGLKHWNISTLRNRLARYLAEQADPYGQLPASLETQVQGTSAAATAG